MDTPNLSSPRSCQCCRKGFKEKKKEKLETHKSSIIIKKKSTGPEPQNPKICNSASHRNLLDEENKPQTESEDSSTSESEDLRELDHVIINGSRIEIPILSPHSPPRKNSISSEDSEEFRRAKRLKTNQDEPTLPPQEPPTPTHTRSESHIHRTDPIDDHRSDQTSDIQDHHSTIIRGSTDTIEESLLERFGSKENVTKMKQRLDQKCSTFFSFVNQSSGTSSTSVTPFNSQVWGVHLIRGESLQFDLTYGIAFHQGSRPSMEDFHFIKPFPSMKDLYEREQRAVRSSDDDVNVNVVSPDEMYAFFSVMDGHGGCLVADYVKTHLHDNITQHPEFFTDTRKAIADGFKVTEKQLQEYSAVHHVDIGGIGTTATVAILLRNVLYVANVGDTEAVLCLEDMPVVMSSVHAPRNPHERKRVEEAGGTILDHRDPGKIRVGHPVWNKNLINIGITRSLGDFYFKDPNILKDKNSGIISEPSISECVITKKDEFLIIASDGFWDVVSYKEAVQWVKRFHGELKINSICQALTNFARSRGASDNITVLLVSFK